MAAAVGCGVDSSGVDMNLAGVAGIGCAPTPPDGEVAVVQTANPISKSAIGMTARTTSNRINRFVITPLPSSLSSYRCSKRLDALPNGVLGTEYGRAGDDDLGSGVDHPADVACLNAAIDLDLRM